MKMRQTVRTGLAILVVGCVGVAHGAEVTTDGGIKVASDDGNFSAQIGGRIQFDGAFYDDDITALDDGTELRRGRLFVKGLVYGDWEYKLETEFANSELDVTDAYLKHKPSGVRIGQIKVPFTLEQLTSSRFIPFMERGVDGLRGGRRVGVDWSGKGDAWNLSTGAFAQNLGADTEGDEGLSFAIRGSYRPWQTDDGDVVHVGVSTFFQEPADQTDTTRLRQRPWSHVTGVRFPDTGTIDNVDKIRGANIEFSSVFDSFSVQAEYVGVDVERKSGFTDEDTNAWYVYATWLSNGGKRNYDRGSGVYKRSKVKSGTWELGVRYSVFDSQSSTLRGGKEEGWTLGANYYVNPKLRFMGNVLFVDTENSEVTRGGENEDIGIVQFRMSFDF